MPVIFVSVNIMAQVRWAGTAGDGQWTTPFNWIGNIVPSANDDVLLDNSAVTGNYTVFLPGSAETIAVKSIVINPASGNNIQLAIPATSTASPAFAVTGPGYGVTINAGGLLVNSSGSSGGTAITVNDSIRINNGGQYTHNTRSSHAALVTILSQLPGTEKGIFKFDVPGGGYTFASTNRSYGTLIMSADASGGVQAYATSAASPLTVNGDFIIQPGVTVNLDITAATVIKGNYLQNGGIFNLASQANNNIVYIKGDLIQTAGMITETSAGLPGIELNGSSIQHIQIENITNSVGFSINNNAGIVLLASLSLPYKLSLMNGIVYANSFLVTLLTGCSLLADSTASNSFINGPLRKEGLSATSHFMFPVGKGISQRWLALKDVTGNFTVEFIKSNPAALASGTGPGINHISSAEYWSVAADAMPAPAAAVELSFDNVNSGGVTDMATLRVAQLLSNVWKDEGNTATTGTAGSAGSVTSVPLTVFDPTINYFTLASSDASQNPLPLKLALFSAEPYGDAVRLSWMIEKSWQPAYFELQSSADADHFLIIAKIDTISNQLSYQYADKRTLKYNQYYRIKAIENDGSVFYSRIIKVGVNGNTYGAVQLRSSLVKDNMVLFINAVTSGRAQVEIFNTSGQLLEAKKIFLQVGNNSILLSLQQLQADLYTILLIDADNKIHASRFVKPE